MNKWQPNEISFLKENYPKFGIKYCSKELNRAEHAIKSKAAKLKIPRFTKPKDGFKFCARCKEEKPIVEFYKPTICYCIKCCSLSRKENGNYFRIWAYHSLKSHKEKGHKITISTQELKEIASKSTNCQYCKKILNWNNKKVADDSPTLDRVFNQQELNINNVLIVCRQCNVTKHNRSIQDFLSYIESIAPNIRSIIQNFDNKKPTANAVG